MVIRDKYLNLIREFYESDLIKVITGIRRCGKSVILNSIAEEIGKKTDNVIFLNFEKTTDFAKASTAHELVDYVMQTKKPGKCYCFFDEIQEIENWQVAVKDLRLENCSVFVTGSNSNLLSSEFITLLSGRFVSFRIRPFVFKEIAKLAETQNFKLDIDDYLIWGGFPARFQYQSESSLRNYLSELENTIVINDLIKRYKIKKTVIFKKIVNFILSNNSRIFSARSVHKIMQSDFPELSSNTVIKFMEYLKNAYIIDEIPQHSTKTKQSLKYYNKLYNSDVCFNSLRVDDKRFDLDHNLENIVYNELLYMGYELKVYKVNNKEIDFIATGHNKKYLIQVAYSVVDKKAYDREMGVFNSIDNASQKILITNDTLDFSTSTVRHIRLKDFLKMEML